MEPYGTVCRTVPQALGGATVPVMPGGYGTSGTGAGTKFLYSLAVNSWKCFDAGCQRKWIPKNFRQYIVYVKQDRMLSPGGNTDRVPLLWQEESTCLKALAPEQRHTGVKEQLQRSREITAMERPEKGGVTEGGCKLMLNEAWYMDRLHWRTSRTLDCSPIMKLYLTVPTRLFETLRVCVMMDGIGENKPYSLW